VSVLVPSTGRYLFRAVLEARDAVAARFGTYWRFHLVRPNNPSPVGMARAAARIMGTERKTVASCRDVDTLLTVLRAEGIQAPEGTLLRDLMDSA